MIRLVELFSGIGAFSKALANLGIPYERVAMCEIDPHAIKVYEALHGPTPNLGDISNSQLYKQAGNSIAVPCLEAILRAMYIDKAWISTPSLDSFANTEEADLDG